MARIVAISLPVLYEQNKHFRISQRIRRARRCSHSGAAIHLISRDTCEKPSHGKTLEYIQLALIQPEGIVAAGLNDVLRSLSTYFLPELCFLSARKIPSRCTRPADNDLLRVLCAITDESVLQAQSFDCIRRCSQVVLFPHTAMTLSLLRAGTKTQKILRSRQCSCVRHPSPEICFLSPSVP